MASLVGWLGLALINIVPARSTALLTGILGLYVLFGVGITGWTVAILRYTLNNAPKERPVLALTLFSVVSSLGNALAPMLWGCFLRWTSDFQIGWADLRLINFSLFYGLIILMIAGCWRLIRRLPDGEAAATPVVLYYMVADYPLRTFNAVYNALFHRARGNDTAFPPAAPERAEPAAPDR